MEKKGVLTLCIIFFVGYASRSQNARKHLSLQEAIASSVVDNDEIKLSVLDEQLAESNFHRTDAGFLPKVNVSYTAVTTNNSLNAFGFRLQQRAIAATDFNPKLLNNPSATADFAAKGELQQPLVNVNMLYERMGAAKQVEMFQLISEHKRQSVLFETEMAYLKLQMLYDADSVLKEAFSTSKTLCQSSKDYFNQGLIQKSDLLNAELNVTNAETQLKNSLSDIEDASDRLSLMMGQPTGTVYTTDPSTENRYLMADSLQLTDERADIKALKAGIEAYGLMISSSKMSYLPKLNAFASFQFNDKRLFGFSAHSYLAGMQLSWTLFDGNHVKNTIIQQNLEREKLVRQLDQRRLDAQVATNHVKRELADAAFAIRQRKLGVEQASEAFRIVQNRYSQGLVKTDDVLVAHLQLSQQKLAHVQAIFDYNLAAVYLEFLTTKK